MNDLNNGRINFDSTIKEIINQNRINFSLNPILLPNFDKKNLFLYQKSKYSKCKSKNKNKKEIKSNSNKFKNSVQDKEGVQFASKLKIQSANKAKTIHPIRTSCHTSDLKREHFNFKSGNENRSQKIIKIKNSEYVIDDLINKHIILNNLNRKSNNENGLIQYLKEMKSSLNSNKRKFSKRNQYFVKD